MEQDPLGDVTGGTKRKKSWTESKVASSGIRDREEGWTRDSKPGGVSRASFRGLQLCGGRGSPSQGAYVCPLSISLVFSLNLHLICGVQWDHEARTWTEKVHLAAVSTHSSSSPQTQQSTGSPLICIKAYQGVIRIFQRVQNFWVWKLQHCQGNVH